MNSQIRCPKCNSTQLTANKKGFSGQNAVLGGLLTGGIGLLAGTIDSNTIKITCLACAYEFKPGEGNTIDKSLNQNIPIIDSIDQRILELCKDNKMLQAVKFCKDAKNIELRKAKDYVDKLAASNGITNKNEGCFIATACYGDYEASEVLVLREYRDNRLLKNKLGKLFVDIYYTISPFFSKIISKSDILKTAIRKHLLHPIVKKLQKDKEIKTKKKQ